MAGHPQSTLDDGVAGVQSWSIEVALSNAKEREDNPELPMKAVKIQAIVFEEPKGDARADWHAQCSGQYRRTYQEWARGDAFWKVTKL